MRIRHFPGSARGSALLLIFIIITMGLLILAAAMQWSKSNVTLNYRYNQYTRSMIAAEGATEKVLVAINHDMKTLGHAYVENNLEKYRRLVPTTADGTEWGKWKFYNSQGQEGRVDVVYTKSTQMKNVSPQYKGLLGFPTILTVQATAKEMNAGVTVVGGAKAAVEQQVQVSLIPVYQFAMFYNMDFECNALPKIDITGPVHCNGNIYLTPVSTLTFFSDVTCTGKIERKPKSGNPIPPQNGTVIYKAAHDGKCSNLALPIGTNNSLTAVRQVIEIPPAGELPTSPIGSQRLYNKADMIIVVTDSAVTITSGRFNNFATSVPWLQATQFIKTNVAFYNGREKKTVRCTDIDIGKLDLWNATNTILRPVLLDFDVKVLFVADRRTANATFQPGVRLVNARKLLPKGLTIASPHPVYILGHYNVTNDAHLGTANTASSVPASIVSDAITFLSTAWQDNKSSNALSTRIAANTTVNAALVSGIVQTSTSKGYSGGVENFPRFLEEWNNRTSTYNGSMVVMFESVHAIGKWDNIGIYYNPPIRNWTFDTRYRDPANLPPATPSAYALVRGEWDVVSAK